MLHHPTTCRLRLLTTSRPFTHMDHYSQRKMNVVLSRAAARSRIVTFATMLSSVSSASSKQTKFTLVSSKWNTQGRASCH